MTAKNKSHLSNTVRTLHGHGATVTGIEQNKHVKIKFETPNGAGQLSIAASPSDYRAPLNVASDIKRQLMKIAARDRPTESASTPAPLPPAPRPTRSARIRQTPFPARSGDRLPAFPNEGGHSGAERKSPPHRLRAKPVGLRGKGGHAPVDPHVKAMEILNMIQDASIAALARAVEREGPKWQLKLAAACVGVPTPLNCRSLCKQLLIWTRRCTLVGKGRIDDELPKFVCALQEIARGYAEAMPEAAELKALALKRTTGSDKYYWDNGGWPTVMPKLGKSAHATTALPPSWGGKSARYRRRRSPIKA